MNRLTKRLTDLKKQNKKALVAYLVAGDPDIETTLQLMQLFIESGVDVIEIGVPFTDPIAEGPIIQKAHDRALAKDISLTSIFEMVQKFREIDNNTPLVLMGYLNTFLSHKNLIEENKKDYIEVPAFTWHTYIMKSEVTVIFETMMGVYDPKTWKKLANWAPDENSAEAKTYLSKLRKN